MIDKMHYWLSKLKKKKKEKKERLIQLILFYVELYFQSLTNYDTNNFPTDIHIRSSLECSCSITFVLIGCVSITPFYYLRFYC